MKPLLLYCSKDGKTQCNEILNTYRACLETYGLRTTLNESRLDADIYVIKHNNKKQLKQKKYTKFQRFY